MSEDWLPDDWTCVDLYADHLLIVAPDIGMVTVNLERRYYRMGLGRGPRPKDAREYRGRGWKRALLADAVNALRMLEVRPGKAPQ